MPNPSQPHQDTPFASHSLFQEQVGRWLSQLRGETSLAQIAKAIQVAVPTVWRNENAGGSVVARAFVRQAQLLGLQHHHLGLLHGLDALYQHEACISAAVEAEADPARPTRRDNPLACAEAAYQAILGRDWKTATLHLFVLPRLSEPFLTDEASDDLRDAQAKVAYVCGWILSFFGCDPAAIAALSGLVSWPYLECDNRDLYVRSHVNLINCLTYNNQPHEAKRLAEHVLHRHREVLTPSLRVNAEVHACLSTLFLLETGHFVTRPEIADCINQLDRLEEETIALGETYRTFQATSTAAVLEAHCGRFASAEERLDRTADRLGNEETAEATWEQAWWMVDHAKILHLRGESEAALAEVAGAEETSDGRFDDVVRECFKVRLAVARSTARPSPRPNDSAGSCVSAVARAAMVGIVCLFAMLVPGPDSDGLAPTEACAHPPADGYVPTHPPTDR